MGRGTERRRSTGVRLAATLWGLAEATLFFIVPDVLLSYAALKRPRAAWIACGWAVAGALAGGALMYAWGRHQPQAALAALDSVPAVSPAMLERVAQALERQGPAAMIPGAFRGTPYKIFAVQSAVLGLPWTHFLLVSVPARLARFALVVLLVGAIARRLPAGWSSRRRRGLLTAFWIVFYTIFLGLMPG